MWGSLPPDLSWLLTTPVPQLIPVASIPIRTANHKPLHSIDSILNGSTKNQSEENELPPILSRQNSANSNPLHHSVPSQRAQEFTLLPTRSRQLATDPNPRSHPVQNQRAQESSLPPTGSRQYSTHSNPRALEAPNQRSQDFLPPPTGFRENSMVPLARPVPLLHSRNSAFTLTKSAKALPRRRSTGTTKQTRPQQHIAPPLRQQQQSFGNAAAPRSSIFPDPSLLHQYHMGLVQMGWQQLNWAFLASQQNALLGNTINTTALVPPQILPLQPPRIDADLVSATGFVEHRIIRTPNPLHHPSNDIQTTVSSDSSSEVANPSETLESLHSPSTNFNAAPASELLSFLQNLPPTPFIQPSETTTTDPDSIAQSIAQPTLIEPRSSPEFINAPAVHAPAPVAPPLYLPLFIDTSSTAGPSHRGPLPSPNTAFVILDKAQKMRMKSHRRLRRFWKAQIRWRKDARKACCWTKKDEIEYKRRTQEKLKRHNLRMEVADSEESEARTALCLSPLEPNPPMPRLPFVRRKSEDDRQTMDWSSSSSSPLSSSDSSMNSNDQSQASTETSPATSSASSSQKRSEQQSTSHPQIPKLVLKRLNSTGPISRHCDTWQIKMELHEQEGSAYRPQSTSTDGATLANGRGPAVMHHSQIKKEYSQDAPTDRQQEPNVRGNGRTIKTEDPEPNSA